MMKAAVCERYGPPEVVQIRDAPKPVPADKVATPSAAAVGEKPKRAEPKALAGKSPATPAPEPAKKPKSAKAIALDEEGEKLLRQWNAMQEQLKNVKPVVYTLQGNYDAKTPIQHKVLGWGYVLKNKGNRIEVLFEEGVKTLVTNYKPS